MVTQALGWEWDLKRAIVNFCGRVMIRRPITLELCPDVFMGTQRNLYERVSIREVPDIQI